MGKQKYTDAELAQKVKDNQKIHDYFDVNYAISLEKNILEKINEHYFRSKFIGFEEFHKRNNPERPLIYISNHSGMAFPWDAIMFASGFLKRANYNMSKCFKILVAPELTRIRVMNAYLIKNFWRRAGGVDATTLNFETLMQSNNTNVFLYPEGIGGIGKGFNKKYELQRFATSFARMSLKYKTDVVPVLTVNGEYINPYTYSFDWINNITKKVGIPFLPIGFILPLIVFCPFLFYFAFPARLTYVMGTRLSPWKWTEKSYEELTRTEIEEITERIRISMQSDLTAAVKKHGEEPYKLWKLIKHNFQNIKRLPYFHSPGWPLLFMEHERQYKKTEEPLDMKISILGLFKFLIRNLFVLSYFIPVLGWIPIIYKGHKKL